MIGERYTVADVAAALKCSRWWIEKQVRLGVVTPDRLGTHKHAPMRFSADHLAQLEASMRPVQVEPPRRRRRRSAA